MTEVFRMVTGSFAANCYLIAGHGGSAVVIDPGDDFESIADRLAALTLHPVAVLCTHAHYDHVAAALPLVEEYGAAFHLHPDDRHLLERVNLYGALFLGERPIDVPDIDVELADGMELHIDGVDVRVVHTPGHSPGSVCFEVGQNLFTGDTLLAQHLGRTDLPGGSREALDASLAQLAAGYRGSTTVRPGHGDPIALAAIQPILATMPELRG